MIWLCAKTHEEICFEGYREDCPICKVIESKDVELKELQEALDELEGELEEIKEKTPFSAQGS